MRCLSINPHQGAEIFFEDMQDVACQRHIAFTKGFHHNPITNISRIIEMLDTPSVIAALSALAQESRLAVFRLLVQAGPEGLAASKIAEILDIAPSSLSFHLKELTHANMISPKKAGRSLIYSTNFETMNALLGFLTENCCGGNVCSSASVSACSKEGTCA